MLHFVTLSNYGIGVCLSAIGLWLYLNWRDQGLTDSQWALCILAILGWPVALSVLPFRLLTWIKRYRSSDGR